MSEKKTRAKYDRQFKIDAVRLSHEPGRQVGEVAQNLGIGSELLSKWRGEFKRQGEISFPGNGIEALTEDQKRIRELEKKLRDAEMERDILKKAVGIFSKLPK